MKPSIAFALGLIVGLGLFAIFSFKNTSREITPPATIDKLTPPPPSASPSSSLAGSASAASPAPEPSLEAALQEIREAGMVVIPQELLSFYTPSFVSGRISPNIQHTFRLDSRELTVLNDARLHFERALIDAADRNLEIVEANDDLLVVKTTTLPEDRKRLIDSMHTEILRGLDEDSASLFAYLDMEKTLGPSTAGLKNATVRIRRIPGVSDFQVTVSDGSSTRITSMTGELLSQLYPSLKNHLPPATQP